MKTSYVMWDESGSPRRNNCVPRAISTALKIPYESVLRKSDVFGVMFDFYKKPDYDGWNVHYFDPATGKSAPERFDNLMKWWGFIYSDNPAENVDGAPETCVIRFGGHMAAKVRGYIYDNKDSRYFDDGKTEQRILGFFIHPMMERAWQVPGCLTSKTIKEPRYYKEIGDERLEELRTNPVVYCGEKGNPLQLAAGGIGNTAAEIGTMKNRGVKFFIVDKEVCEHFHLYDLELHSNGLLKVQLDLKIQYGYGYGEHNEQN